MNYFKPFLAFSALFFGFQLQANVQSDRPNALSADQLKVVQTDAEITRRIREIITNDNEISNSVKRIKILTQNGKVTLKGFVNSKAEKNTLLKTAQSIAGVPNVIDRLSVNR